MTDTATLTKRLAEAETALHKLMTGTKVVSVKSDVGETRYSERQAGDLRAYIVELKTQLGQTGKRRGTGLRFLG